MNLMGCKQWRRQNFQRNATDATQRWMYIGLLHLALENTTATLGLTIFKMAAIHHLGFLKIGFLMNSI